MGRKRSKKNKTEHSQEQPIPPHPTPGPSGDPGTSRDAGTLQSAVEEIKVQQQLQKQAEQASPQPPSLELKQEVPWQHVGQQKTLQLQPGSRGKGGDQQQIQQAAPSSQGGRGAWKRGQPSSPHALSPSSQQQTGFSQYERRGSRQQSIPSPQLQQQPGLREPQKQAHGRGTGRGWQQPRELGQRQQGPSHSQKQTSQSQLLYQQQEPRQVSGAAQRQQPSQLDSPQTVEGAWQGGPPKQVPQQLPPASQTGHQIACRASQTPTPEQPPTHQKVSGQEQRTILPKASAPPDSIIPQRKKLKSEGTAGKKILIETNHLLLTLRKSDPVVLYDVTIEPDKPKRLLRGVMEAFRNMNYPNRYPAFDGAKSLYSCPILPFGEHINGEVTIEEDGRPKNYQVTVNFAKKLDLSVINRYFESADVRDSMVNTQHAIQCLDVVLRSAPALCLIPVGRSFFTIPHKLIDLGEGMEMYHGFYQSAILGWKPFLNVDVSHKPFPKSMRVVDIIKELCPRCDLTVHLSQRDFNTVDKFVRTLKVQYVIPNNPASRRVMRVNELDRPASEARFRLDNGQETTVEQYFSNQKGFRLQYPKMPCLWVGSRTRESRMLFPVELCTLVEGQVTNRSMTAKQTTAMIKQTATSTYVRKERIMDAIRLAGFNQSETAQEFGISVNENFEKVTARVLDAPTLSYANRIVRPQKGVWNAEKFKDVRPLLRWCIFCIDRVSPIAAQEFADMVIQQGASLGMQIVKPTILPPVTLTYRKEKQELEQHFRKLKDMQLILVVISDVKEIYYYVKQVAELSVGTLTQCVRGRNFSRPKVSTVKNILLKINAKLNGVNHILEQRPQCLDPEKPCMIMGADVTHPSPENKGTVPSVAAVTASHDLNAFQYNICWRLQKSGQEIIDDLANIVKEHLTFFNKKNNYFPEQIIFFRDGVSEGQFQTVLNAELHAIRQACTTVKKGEMYKPNITFLVVQKRHHTRFFPTNQNYCDDKRNYNVPAGTVVDTHITHPTALDFYLVSHASIQGVARPTKYRQLWDDSNMTEDELEQLTYHLCHMFTRCTRSVSYPAPTYYAHLAAARAKVYCEKRQVNMNNLEREQQQLTVKSEIIKDLPMFFV